MESVVAARWPLFYDQLVAVSPFRAVLSTPLRHGLGRCGTLNLLLHNDAGFADLTPEDVHAVNDVISQTLLLALTPSEGSDDGRPAWAVETGPAWLDGPFSALRSSVFVAIGMLIDALNVSEHDALALLRARAFTTGQTVDIIAVAVTELRLSTTELDPYATL